MTPTAILNRRAIAECVDANIRVSRKLGRSGPGYISPDVQRESHRTMEPRKGGSKCLTDLKYRTTDTAHAA